jgi:hypothetical protein
MDSALRAGVALVSSVLALSLISVFLSNSANTAGIIKASSSGLSSLIAAATKPITG